MEWLLISVVYVVLDNLPPRTYKASGGEPGVLLNYDEFIRLSFFLTPTLRLCITEQEQSNGVKVLCRCCHQGDI